MTLFRRRLTGSRVHGLTKLASRVLRPAPRSRGLRPYGLRLAPRAWRPYWGKIGFGACVGVILVMSIGIQPKIGISVPARSIPFSSSMISKNSLLFDLRRQGFNILENLMGPGFDNTEMRDFLETAITGMGPCPTMPPNGKAGLLTGGECSGTGCCLVGLPEWACGYDLNQDGHFLYYDTLATSAYAQGIMNQNLCDGIVGGPACPPKFELTPYPNNAHDGSHPNEPHLDAAITLYDAVFEVKARAVCINCDLPVGVHVFPIKMVINPNKVDVNNVNSRTDDPVITVDIPTVDVTMSGTVSACGLFDIDLSCVAPLVEPMLEDPLRSAITSQFLGFLPMDMNAMFASEPAYSCPNYSGTVKNPWCKWGVQTDPNKDGYGYCRDCEGGSTDNNSTCPGVKEPDGVVETNLPAYNAAIAETPPTTYGTMSCGDALINMGVYPHLQISNADGVRSNDDRMTMNMDLGCEVQEAAPDIDKTRIDVQDKLCKPGACAPYPTCCSLTQPTNPNGFACAVGQDVGNQITNAIAQSGLVSCEVSKDGLKTGLPIPVPLDMSQFLKVESFANLIPPIDDSADPGSYVKIRWRPYGDGNVATKEVCAAIGGEPGPAYGCSALCKNASNPANAAYCADPLNCCYPSDPVDINFSFRNIYTDFFIQVGGNPDTKAFGVSADLGGALDMEFKTALQGNRVFANKAAFLTSGCNPLAGGTVDCLKVALDPVDIMNVQFRYQEIDPTYTLNMASLAQAFPDVLVNLIGGAAQAWVETQIQLAGLGFNMVSAGADTGGWPDQDGNGRADYLTCTGNFAGSFDLIQLLSLLTGGAGGGGNPCDVENLKAYARRSSALAASSRLTADGSRLTSYGGPETFIIHPFTGNPEANFQFVAEESRRASLIPEKPVRLQLHGVGSGVMNYTWRLDKGVWRVSTEPVIQLPYLLEGNHILEVQAVDGTGLADPTPATFIFQIDTQPPKINLFGLTAYANVAAPGEEPVYFVDSNVLRVEVSDFQTPFTHIKASYFLDGKEVKMTEPKADIDPSRLSRAQEHVLSARATDVSGLESVREWRFTFRKETDTPEDETFFGCEQIR